LVFGPNSGDKNDVSRTSADLRKHCEEIAEKLPISRPFSMMRFVDSLNERRARRIELIGMVARSDTPCGMLVNTKEADYIFYASNTTLLHQQHIIAHEIGHLLCDHRGPVAKYDTIGELLLKNLSAKLITRVLGRTAYSEAEEAEAEMLATVILMRAGVAEPDRTTSSELASGLDRLRLIFG
jgi:hypothetical protein